MYLEQDHNYQLPPEVYYVIPPIEELDTGIPVGRVDDHGQLVLEVNDRSIYLILFTVRWNSEDMKIDGMAQIRPPNQLKPAVPVPSVVMAPNTYYAAGLMLKPSEWVGQSTQKRRGLLPFISPKILQRETVVLIPRINDLPLVRIVSTDDAQGGLEYPIGINTDTQDGRDVSSTLLHKTKVYDIGTKSWSKDPLKFTGQPTVFDLIICQGKEISEPTYTSRLQ